MLVSNIDLFLHSTHHPLNICIPPFLLLMQPTLSSSLPRPPPHTAASTDFTYRAGVTGLTSAWFLAEAGYKVTVIAAHVPGDESIEYTSPWYVFPQRKTERVGADEEALIGLERTGERLQHQTSP